MTRIAQLRAQHKGEFERKNDAKLTFMPFFIRAVVDGATAHQFMGRVKKTLQEWQEPIL